MALRVPKSILKTLSAIALLAVLSSTAYFLHFHDYYMDDSPSYVAPAANLVAGHGFMDSAGFPETIRTPGYPLLIVPFLWLHLDLKYLIILQHAMRVLIILGTSWFAFHLTGSHRQAFIAGLLVCIDLPTLAAANTITTELFFTLTLIVAIWLLFTASTKSNGAGWRLTLSGLLTGASVLIRPVSLFLFLPVMIYLILVRKSSKIRAALIFGLSFALLPALWAERNHQKAGAFVVSSIPGWNMLAFRAAGVLAINDRGDFYANLARHQAELQAQVCEEMKGSFGSDCVTIMADQAFIPQKSEYYMRLGRRIVAQHPVGYLKVALRGAALMMLGGDAYSISQMTGVSQRTAAKLFLIYSLPALCSALLGLTSLRIANASFFYLNLFVIGYFVAVSAGAEAYSRFRVPIMSLYAILIAFGLEFVLARCLRTPKLQTLSKIS